MYFGVLMSKFGAMVLGMEKHKYLEKAQSDSKPQIPWGDWMQGLSSKKWVSKFLRYDTVIVKMLLIKFTPNGCTSIKIIIIIIINIIAIVVVIIIINVL